MTEEKVFQRLNKFSVPQGFRGRHVVVVQLWWIVQATFFVLSPQFAYSWRASLLRLFGAEVGVGTKIRPSVRITYPWKASIGDYCWIGDRAELYNLTEIKIGKHVCISQDCYLASAGHDLNNISFGYTTGAIVIEDEAWLASGVFVTEDVIIGKGAVAAARSVILNNVDAGIVVAGHPARFVRVRNWSKKCQSR